MEFRVNAVSDLVNNSDDTWMVWCHLNDESEMLGKAISNSVTVQGSDSIDHKENSMNGFSHGSINRLIKRHRYAVWYELATLQQYCICWNRQ